MSEKESLVEQPNTNQNNEIAKKDIVQHFLLFRFVGSIIWLLILGGLVELLKWDSDLIVGILVITILNVPIQLFYLVRAYIAYVQLKKHKEI